MHSLYCAVCLCLDGCGCTESIAVSCSSCCSLDAALLWDSAGAILSHFHTALQKQQVHNLWISNMNQDSALEVVFLSIKYSRQHEF